VLAIVGLFALRRAGAVILLLVPRGVRTMMASEDVREEDPLGSLCGTDCRREAPSILVASEVWLFGFGSAV